MATLTPNYGLSMPEPTDPFGYNSFLPLFNENMEIIDENMGGGGDSVSYTQTLATGSKVGEIEINGVSQDINAPTYVIAVKTNPVGTKYIELSSPDSGDSSSIPVTAINPSIIWFQNAMFDSSGDFIGSLGVDNILYPVKSRSYIGGDGIEVTPAQSGERIISSEYFKVVNGELCQVYDDGE